MSLDTYFEKRLATFLGSQGRLKRSIFVSSILKVFPEFYKKILTWTTGIRTRLSQIMGPTLSPLDYGGITIRIL